jgi:hypothetical protein
MNSRILIIEGTSGVGKSHLVDALVRKYIEENEKIRSLLHLTQAHTYGPLAVYEDMGLTKEMNKKHLEQVYNALQWFASSLASEHKVKFFCLIDTLHITHCVRPGIVEWKDVSSYDTKLKQIECKLVFIKAKPATIWDRGIAPRLNEQFMLEYAKKFGNNLEEIHQYFVNEQQKLEEIVNESSMEKICLNAEDDFRQNLDETYRFWLQ